MASRDSSTSRGSSMERKEAQGMLTKALGKIRRSSAAENLTEIDPLEGSSGLKKQESWAEDMSSGSESEDRSKREVKKGGKFSGKGSKKGKDKLRVDKKSQELEESDTEEDDPLHVSFTKANPLGKVLLNLLADNLALQEKCGITESNLSAKDLCKAFHSQMESERKLIKAGLDQAADITEERILSREFNSLCVSQDETLPCYFSKRPKLITNSANVEALKLFPTKIKFSGSNYESLTLQEFFHNLKIAQEQMRLTEEEFIKMMLQCTSGRANELLNQWISQKEGINEIYFNLTLHFDKRMTTETARQKLLTIMAPKTSDLARHISNIMTLAQRAASAIPAGVSRTSYFNNEAINALMRSLPPASRTTCSNLFHTLSAKARRAITFNELTRPLITLRDTIDADIKAHGVGPSSNAQTSKFSERRKAKRMGPPNKMPTTFVVNAQSGEPEPIRYRQKRPNFRSNHNQQSTVYLTASGNNAQKQNNASANFKRQQTGNQPYRTNQAKRKYCSLCGETNHTAAQGCRHMRDANNRVVNVQPTQSTCNACPPTVSPRLNHPAVFCPFRPNGPLHGRR